MPHELEAAGPKSDIALGEIAQALRRRFWPFLAILLACVAAAALITRAAPRLWQATAEMALIQRATNSGGPKESYAAPIVESVETQMAMLQSDAITQRTLQWLRANVGPRDPRLDIAHLTAPALQHAVSITNPKDTDILQVSAEAPSRAQAALLADATCQAFLDWKRDIARQQVAVVVNNLQERSSKAEAGIRDAQRQETSFKQSHHVSDPAAQEKSLLDQYQAQQAQVSDLQKETASLQARLAGLNGQLQAKNAHIQRSGGVRDDALVSSLQAQLDQLKMERADAAQKYTAKYPGMLSGLDAKIHDTRARLDDALKGILNGSATTLQSQNALLDQIQQARDSQTYSQAKLAAAQGQADALRAQIGRIPEIDAEYKQIERNVQATNDLYLSIQPDLAAARADLDRANGPVQITQRAIVPMKPARPNKAQNLALGGLAGLFLASFAVILLESGDRRVRDRADVLRLTPGLILGSLPPLTLSGPALPPLVGLTYRRAYANLLLALRQSGQKAELRQSVILVTSAVPGEGKSLTANQLARAIAASGKRTILVDADPSTPSAHKAPAPSGGPLRAEPFGLSDVLRGAVLPAEALAATDQQHLLRLGQGRARTDIEEMISQPEMERTLAALRACADVIVIDAPACSERADALFLAPHADCIVQVIGAGRVDAAPLQQTSESLTAARPRLLAYFLNFSPEQNVSRLRNPAPSSDGYSRTAGRRHKTPVLPAEQDVIEDNRTTEIIVQHVPGQPPLIRLAWPGGVPPIPSEEISGEEAWPHRGNPVR